MRSSFFLATMLAAFGALAAEQAPLTVDLSCAVQVVSAAMCTSSCHEMRAGRQRFIPEARSGFSR
jgi:hypothetical protein